jgi:hypothetical protein
MVDVAPSSYFKIIHCFDDGEFLSTPIKQSYMLVDFS